MPGKWNGRRWCSEIRAASEYKEQYGRSKLWTVFKDYYYQRYKYIEPTCNLIHSFGRALVPNTYFKNPKIRISATRPGMDMHARVVEEIDNKLLHKLKIKNTTKKCAKDVYLCGTACVKHGYDSEFGYNPYDDLFAGFVPTDEVKGRRIEHNMLVNPGYPWHLRLRPEDLIVPWGTDEIESSHWVGHGFWRMYDDMKDDPKYSKKVRDKLQPTMFVAKSQPEKESQRQFVPGVHQAGDTKWIYLYEIRDLMYNRVLELSLDYEDGFLYEGKDELDFFPYTILQYDDYDYFWSAPDALAVLGYQLELDDTIMQMQKHRRVSIVKLLIAMGAMTPEEIKKLVSKDVQAVAQVKGVDLDKVVKVIQTSQIPFDLLAWRKAMFEDARMSFGFSANQLGEFDVKSRRTATEVSEVSARANVRIDERRDATVEFVREIMEKNNKIIFKEWSYPNVLPIVGPDNTIMWVQFVGSDLDAEYSLQLDPEEATPISRAMRKMERLGLFSMLKEDPFTEPMALREFTFKEIEGLDPRKLFRPPTMPGGAANPMNINAAQEAFGKVK